MALLFSDLIDGSGRRYFFNLKSAPGGVSPSQPAQLTIIGLAPTILNVVQVFRTPAPAQLTLQGLQPASQPRLLPGLGQLTLQGLIPGTQRQIVVTNATPAPDYNPAAGLIPTLVLQMTVTPAPAQLAMQGREPNSSPGGDIVYVTPAPAQLTMQGGTPTVIFLETGVGELFLQGLAPTLQLSLIVTPEPGSLIVAGPVPSVDQPFIWIDVDPPPESVWTTAFLDQ